MSNSLRRILRSKKFYCAVGVLSGCGILIYEKYKINEFLSNLVRPGVLDIEKKRPDYIYIKYHVYRESMKRLQLELEEDKNWINVIINPIGKWWKAFKHSVAWRLLNIAQTGNQYERLKAVRQLASIDHLKDWDFRHLAQICDARTAVSLARSGCDVRWFIPVHMHGVIKNPKYALTDLHKLLESLLPNKCTAHFLNKYFPPTEQSLADIDEFVPDGNALSVEDTDLLKEIISFLHHVTKDVRVCTKIVAEGGLSHLMELRKIFQKDNETLSTLCKVLANMSMEPESVDHFFESGWLSVLAEWQQCNDLRLQVTAAKALANLDRDDPNYMQYPPNVYPLHPLLRTRRKPKADIVFIHGLLGSVFITWRQKDRVPTELGLYGKNAFYTSEMDDVFLVNENKRTNTRNGANKRAKGGPDLDISDIATKELVETLMDTTELDSDWEVVHPDIPLKANEDCAGQFSINGNKWTNKERGEYTNCWPMDWLPEDYPNARILGIDYRSAVSEWSAHFTKYCPCEKNLGHIEVRAANLLERMTISQVGDKRPVVWIGHSMGGILTKIMLMNAMAAEEPEVQQIAKNTKGIVFLGTPHRGSPIAKWKQHMQMILSPSIEVKEMEENSPKLIDIHDRFMNSLQTSFRDVNIVSIAEGTPTMLTTFKFPLRIVTEESAWIGHGDFYILKDDHLSLSKPIFRQSFLYHRLLEVIEQSVNPRRRVPAKVEMSDERPLSIPAPNFPKTSFNFWSLLPAVLVNFLG